MHPLARSIALGLFLAASTAHAAPWTYRGTLNDGGVPANGRYDIRLSLLDAAGAKSLAYPLTYSGVEVKNGAFAIDVDFGMDLTQFGPLKLKTEVAQGGSGFVALGEPKAFDAKAALAGVCWDTQGNAGTNPGTDFLGTTDNQPLLLRVNNQRALQVVPDPVSPNLVAGYSGNSVTASVYGASIGGGGDAVSQNRVTDNHGTVGGGKGNTAGDDDALVSDAEQATVSGGVDNRAMGYGSTVGGGGLNTASGQSSTVGGGALNTASGFMSSVGGGSVNCAGGDYSWAGGRRAKVRPGTTSGLPGDGCSGVSLSGDADGDNGSFVWADSQFGDFVSTGPNQFLVRADGGVGINGTPAVAGLEMNVFGTTPFDGFVEVGLIPKPSLNGNTGERVEFGVGKGGAGANDADLRIAHRNDSSAFFEHLSIDGDGSVIVRSNPANLAQGVQLLVGAGAWSTLSDRNVKTNVQSIDTRALLDRLVAMPVQQWRYIGQPGEVQHIGPMAQDFAAAFGVGENDTTISTVDADGVALAAIQGLNAKLESELKQTRAQNLQLQTQLEQLATRLAALEAAKEQ